MNQKSINRWYLIIIVLLLIQVMSLSIDINKLESEIEWLEDVQDNIIEDVLFQDINKFSK